MEDPIIHTDPSLLFALEVCNRFELEQHNWNFDFRRNQEKIGEGSFGSVYRAVEVRYFAEIVALVFCNKNVVQNFTSEPNGIV